jgi:hypothetical protein
VLLASLLWLSWRLLHWRLLHALVRPCMGLRCCLQHVYMCWRLKGSLMRWPRRRLHMRLRLFWGLLHWCLQHAGICKGCGRAAI